MQKFKLIILIVTAFLAACSASTSDGAKFVGNWHTAPLSEMVTKQLFLEIKPAGGDNYSVDSHWISGSVSGRKDVSGNDASTYVLTKGALVGSMGITIVVDDKGIIRFGGNEYRK